MSRGLHVSLCWTCGHLGHLDLPSPQGVSLLLCPQQHLAALTILIWTLLHETTWLSRFLLLHSHPSPGLLGSFLPFPATSQSPACPCSPYPLTFLRAPQGNPSPQLASPPPSRPFLNPRASLPSRQGQGATSFLQPSLCLMHSFSNSASSQQSASSPHLCGRQEHDPHGQAPISPVPCWPWYRESPGGRPVWRTTPSTWRGNTNMTQAFQSTGGGTISRLYVRPS